MFKSCRPDHVAARSSVGNSPARTDVLARLDRAPAVPGVRADRTPRRSPSAEALRTLAVGSADCGNNENALRRAMASCLRRYFAPSKGGSASAYGRRLLLQALARPSAQPAFLPALRGAVHERCMAADPFYARAWDSKQSLSSTPPVAEPLPCVFQAMLRHDASQVCGQLASYLQGRAQSDDLLGTGDDEVEILLRLIAAGAQLPEAVAVWQHARVTQSDPLGEAKPLTRIDADIRGAWRKRIFALAVAQVAR